MVRITHTLCTFVGERNERTNSNSPGRLLQPPAPSCHDHLEHLRLHPDRILQQRRRCQRLPARAGRDVEEGPPSPALPHDASGPQLLPCLLPSRGNAAKRDRGRTLQPAHARDGKIRSRGVGDIDGGATYRVSVARPTDLPIGHVSRLGAATVTMRCEF